MPPSRGLLAPSRKGGMVLLRGIEEGRRVLRRGGFLLLVLLGAALLLPALAVPGAGKDERPVVVSAMEGVIGPPQADWMAQSLKEAARRNARALVLRLDDVRLDEELETGLFEVPR